MAQMTYRSGDPLLINIFGVYFKPQTYLNLLYLLMSFPLGLAYFIFLITGLSLGFGLIITLAGVPLLVVMLVSVWVLTTIERLLAIHMLGENIPPIFKQDLSGLNLWQRLKALLTNSVTWTGLIYLFAKFPIGVGAFVMTTVLFAFTFGFITAPIYYRWGDIDFGAWRVDTLNEAFLLVPIGIAIGLVAPHITNVAAYLLGRFAYTMLGARWWESTNK